MAPRPTRLLALSLLVGAFGCGIAKPEETTGVDPAGGQPDLGGGLGQATGGMGSVGAGGSGGVPFGGNGGGASNGGHPGGGGTGGTIVTGSGGIPGSGSSGGTGAGSTPGTGGGGRAGTTGSSGGSPASGGTPGTGGVTGSGGSVWTNGTCDQPYAAIPTDVSHFEIDVSNVDGAGTVGLPCASPSTVVVLSFDLLQNELVYADTLGASWDTVLAFADACDGTWSTLQAGGTTACNDNACGTSQSQAVALLGYGRHYLYVGGSGSAHGVATVHFQHAPVGAGPLTQFPPGTGTAYGTTQGRGAVNQCTASGADNSYWWQSCPFYAGGTLSASTCNAGTSFDTVLTLQLPGTSVVSCADDDPSCGVQSKMSATIPAGAGLYVLTVDGTAGSDQGPYTLTFTRP